MKKNGMAVVLLFVVALSFASGCRAYPTYESGQTVDNVWHAEIDGTKYVLWPDQDWLLLDDETGEKIGYLDSGQTVLYSIASDAERNYIKVYEAGVDALHVPLVKESMAGEFSLDRVDAVEWSKWGIHADNLTELIGKDTVTNQASLDQFRAYLDDEREDAAQGEWNDAGTIYCFNSCLPGVVYALEADYRDGMIRCSAYNSPSYVLIPLVKLEDILGPMPERN